MDPAVLQVLQDRLGFLLGLEGDLRNGAMLGPVIARADQDAMWQGPVRVAFLGWLRDLNRFVVERLPEGIAAVAASLEAWIRDQGPVGLPALTGVVWGDPPATPRKVGWTMGHPPPFVMDLRSARGEIYIDPDVLDAFAGTLGQVADGIFGFGKRVGESVAPFALPPGPPLASPLTGPGGGMPVDAADAVGWPNVYRAMADGLLAAGEDLRGRAARVREAGGGACPAGPPPVFSFPDTDAAKEAAKADGKAVVKILDRRSSPKEEIDALTGWLEATCNRAGDPVYAGEVLRRISAKRIDEAIDMAMRAGPETRERMLQLIASASRGGTLDRKVEAALLRSPHLRLLAENDVQYSNALAARMANTLLDPRRVDDSRWMVPGPSEADVKAASHLMERYGLGHLVDAEHLSKDPRLLDDGRLVALMGNAFLPPGLVADTIQLAIAGHKENAEAQSHLDAVLKGLADGAECSGETKRVIAAELATDMEGLAFRLGTDADSALPAREAVWELMGDKEARQELVESAGHFVAQRFTNIAGDLGRVLSANTTMKVGDAFDQIERASGVLGPAGEALNMLAGWPGSKGSDVATLLGSAFGVALAGVGLVATGGTATVVLAAVGAAAGEVSRSAQDDANQKAEHQARRQKQDIHDRAQQLAVAALLLTPGNPPLRDVLIGSRPNHQQHPTFVAKDGTITIPEPNTDAWQDFYRWMTSGENPKLETAVHRLLAGANFEHSSASR